VVATHALELLDLSTARAEFLLLARDSERGSTAVIAEDLISSLDAYASEIGISRGDALRVARAFLVVEGKNDRTVVQHFYAPQIADHRMVVLPLYGRRNALALVEVRYLAKLALPIVFLCDKARAKFLKHMIRPSPAPTTSRRSLRCSKKPRQTRHLRCLT
jgi:hypothetical protein